MTDDILSRAGNAVLGYPRLAEKIGIAPEYGIYRHFQGIGARILLYKQAEILRLSRDLSRLEQADSRSTEGDMKRYSSDWNYLKNSESDTDHAQWKLIEDIMKKYDEYAKWLCREVQLAALPAPDAEDREDLRKLMTPPGQEPPYLTGPDAEVWTQPGDDPDLIALRGRDRLDPFTSWVNKLSHSFFKRRHKRRHRNSNAALALYDERKVHRVTSIITGVVGSLLPIVAIVVLYSAGSMALRLALIAIFGGVFSSGLHLLTRVKGTEAFAGAAAFMAVQVVFLNNNNV